MAAPRRPVPRSEPPEGSDERERSLAITHRPREPLAAGVEFFWLSVGPRVAEARERVLPDGTMQLIISLTGEPFRVYDSAGGGARRLSGPIVTGARTRFVEINRADVVATAGIAFRAGGARPFLGVPAGELEGCEVELDALWGVAAAGELSERVRAAATPAAVFAVLEELLLRRPAWRLTPHPAVVQAVQALDGLELAPSVAEMAAAAGLSQRHFIAVFRDAIGLTPKRFVRVRRFQQVLRLVEGGRPVPWAEVAAACGYYDQAHLIHDFRAFAGLTPRHYPPLRTRHRNHVLLP